jgi:MFS family permease
MHPTNAAPFSEPATAREPAGMTKPPARPGITYDASFWFACLAHAALMTSMGVLFRYADFIAYLVGQDGHVEGHLGWIVGVGMVGALVMRGFQGFAIDRYGPRVVWLSSLTLLVAGLLAHMTIERVDTPPIYILRILLMTGTAGAFGAAITFTSLRSPAGRMPEMIGVMGSSGFLGWILGPVLGDLLLAGSPPNEQQVTRLFLMAVTAAAAAFLFAAAATRKSVCPALQTRPSLAALLRTYHPGVILLVGIAMGFGVGLPHTFLRAYTAHLGVDQIKTFFVVYSVTAFAVRITTRRFPEIIGIRAMNVLGLAALAASMLLYLPVRNEWMLALPAVAAGSGHGLLFPAVVGGGSSVFPRQFRGTGTILMLAMFDVGGLIGQPTAGSLVETARMWSLPPYPTMFIAVAAAMCLTAAVYALATRKGTNRATAGR